MIVNNVDVNKNSLKTILLFFTASPLMRNTVNDPFIPQKPDWCGLIISGDGKKLIKVHFIITNMTRK
ncbi:hypothetical protein CN402_16260 [Bacillus sp. AFS015896]|uniref:Uncharacterized protein n=1 Tax=Bacillus cereus TaxID=1396 RepID=A0A2A8J2D3_BACCE|nr:hypothetical protein CN476_09335 [Bacillus cereus]PFA59769.1 hypothetical protein CN402_16260 [Bacillus sp. AFS015896]PGU03458.1 hypothetical protein COD19_09700 [Bacillus cereus]PGX13517.1 hypothetical protein COE07_07875 [Bacillus sp. AFS033286]PGZ72662.1 hypothetical protein COE49_16225 [Bacillus sp. AFS029637]